MRLISTALLTLFVIILMPASLAQHTSMNTSGTCTPTANSTGASGVVNASGSFPSLTLTFSNLPANEFGQVIFGPMTCPNSTILIGAGTLCVCGDPATGQGICRSNVFNSGAGGAGVVVLPLPDPTNPSQPCTNFPGIFVGSTWNFQMYHRDGATTNLSNGVAVLIG